MSSKEEFIEIFKANITREGADKLLDYLENRSDFFTAPASARYHGAYEGGLCEHSLNVYHCLTDYLQRERVRELYGLEYSDESVAVVSLLHDVCKVGCYKKGFRNVKNDATGQWEKVPTYTFDDPLPYGHGEKSVYIVNGFIRLTREEAMAIRWHMGFSGPEDNRTVGQALQKYPLAFALATADMEASYFLEGEEYTPPPHNTASRAPGSAGGPLSYLVWLLGVLDQPVVPVVPAVDHGEGAVGLLVPEGEEAVPQQVHLQNSLVPGHGLQGEGLAAHDTVLPLLRLVRGEGGDLVHIQGPLEGPLAQPLLQPGLVLADLPLQGGDGGVDGGVHIRGALRHPEDGAAGADGDFHLVVPLLLHTECDGGGGVLLKETVQLAHFLLRVLVHRVGQVHLFVRKHEFHTIRSFRPWGLVWGRAGRPRPFPSAPAAAAGRPPD